MMSSNFNAKSAKAVWRNIAVAVFAMVFALLGLGVTVLPTRAATGNFVVVGEIYESAGNVQKLYDLIAGEAHTSFDKITELATAKTTAADIRSKTYQKNNGQDVQVTFGGKVWDVVYLSTTNDNRPILTLWLHDSIGNHQWNTWALDDLSVNYPSNMYGTSHIRALINNGGKCSESGGMALTDYEPVADYVLQEFVDGKYADLIVTPSYVDWQKEGQRTSYSNPSGVVGNRESPNECWGEIDYNFITVNGISMNCSDRDGYNTWKGDNLWLVSYTEVMSFNTTMFLTSAAQRVTPFWERTTWDHIMNNVCNGFDGGVGVTNLGQVRPALHLDLAALNFVADATLSDITLTYNAADQQDISQWATKPVWYSDDMECVYTQNGVVVPEVKDVGEYDITVHYYDHQNTVKLTVLPQEVTVSGEFVGVDRVYKREREVELDKTQITVNGLITGDEIGITYRGFMDDKNAGEKSVTVTATLTGDSAKNYVLTESQFMTTVTITPQTVSIINVKTKDKEYDGTVRAILDTTDIKYTGLIDGDDLTVLVSGEYEQKNVGDNLTVTLSYSGLDGLDKNNYQIALEKCQATIEDCNIKQRVITVTLNDQVVKVGDKKTLTARVSSGSLATGDSANTVYQLYLDEINPDELDYANLDVGAYKITGKCINDNYYIDFIDGTYRVLSEEEWDALQPKEEPKDNNMWLIIIIVIAIAAFIGALVGIGLVIRSHDKNRDPKPKKDKKNKDKAENPTPTATADGKAANK